MRLLAIGLVCALSVLNCAAQQSGMGINIGAQVSNIAVKKNNQTLKGSSIVGPVLGVLHHNNVTDKMRLVSTFALSFSGADFTDEVNDSTRFGETSSIATDQLRLVNATWSILPGYAIHDMVHVLAGPELSVMLGRNLGTFDPYKTKAMVILDESDKRFTFNFVLGGAFCYKRLRLDGRYNIGLSNYFKDEVITSSAKYEGYKSAKINSFSLSGSYMLSQ